MARKVLFPNAIDYMRVVNTNMVDNALASRSAFVMLPSLYQRAHTVVYETGELPINDRFVAPDEEITRFRRAILARNTGNS